MRYIGVDLHTTQITVCYLTEKEEENELGIREGVGKGSARGMDGN